MKIDVKSKDSVYVEINDWTFCIDDSTNEQIVCKWKTGESGESGDVAEYAEWNKSE